MPGSAFEELRRLGWKPEPCLGCARLLWASGVEPQAPGALGPGGGRKQSDLGVDPSWKGLSAGVRGSWTPQLLLGVRTGERKELLQSPSSSASPASSIWQLYHHLLPAAIFLLLSSPQVLWLGQCFFLLSLFLCSPVYLWGKYEKNDTPNFFRVFFFFFGEGYFKAGF